MHIFSLFGGSEGDTKIEFLTINSQIMLLRKKCWKKSCRVIKNEYFHCFGFFAIKWWKGAKASRSKSFFFKSEIDKNNSKKAT